MRVMVLGGTGLLGHETVLVHPHRQGDVPIGQAHRQGRRVLAGVGSMHLVGRDLGRDAVRQVDALEASLLRSPWQGVGGNRDDETSVHER